VSLGKGRFEGRIEGSEIAQDIAESMVVGAAVKDVGRVTRTMD